MEFQNLPTKRQFISHAPGFWPPESLAQWHDPKWQLKNRINTLSDLERHLKLTDVERAGVILSGSKLAMSITPHYFNLIDRNDPDCPIRRQVIPRLEENWTAPEELADPCGEDDDMPVPGLVHRYPDRVLFLVTDRCASYCRYCTRSRVVSGVGEQKLETQWEAAFKYLENTPQVRDVLLSGGDPLLLSDGRLEKILRRLRAIPHIEFVRIGSRIPIFLPQRITKELCEMLQRYHPLFISIHANHPKELTYEVKEALERLANHGVVMGNQSVLLRGVNDSAEVLKELSHRLLMCRVRPYYLYQCDLIEGSSHLRTTVAEGLDIMGQLRGHTTGYAIPQYVVDGPGGGGKIPLNPDYITEQDATGLKLKNFEGNDYSYPTPSEIPAAEFRRLMHQSQLPSCS